MAQELASCFCYSSELQLNKCRIIFARHWKATLFRALLLPALYSGYLIATKQFYNDNNVYSAGEAKPMQPLPTNLLGNMLVVAGAPDGSTAHTLVTTALSSTGVDANVQYVDAAQDIVTMCPESFGDISPCFAGLVFGDLDVSTGTLNYTMRGDDGLTQVDPVDLANDDFQKRFLPLQWAIESVRAAAMWTLLTVQTWINMTTGTLPDPPLVWEYTTETQEQYKESLRKSELWGAQQLIADFQPLPRTFGRCLLSRTLSPSSQSCTLWQAVWPPRDRPSSRNISPSWAAVHLRASSPGTSLSAPYTSQAGSPWLQSTMSASSNTVVSGW